MKKTWTQPEVKELEIKNTEHGTQIKDTPDGVYTDPNGNNWYSFS